jgi:hypothetical protein
MLERDDEDLAIDQLPGAGRADNAKVASPETNARVPRQEQGATRAEAIPATASAERLHELRSGVKRLRTQVAALPTRELQRVEDLNARAITLTTQCEEITQRLEKLPQTRWRLGREQDPNPVERAHLTSALQAAEREIDALLNQRVRLTRELGDPSEVRSERDGLQRALTQLTREHTEVLNQLAEREVDAPGPWAQRTLGERPDDPQLRKEWEQGIRQVATYRLQYEVTDSDDPLGAKPRQQEQQRDRQRAHNALDRSARRLGRDVDVDHDLGIEVGP